MLAVGPDRGLEWVGELNQQDFMNGGGAILAGDNA
jgi:hypothetical protein